MGSKDGRISCKTQHLTQFIEDNSPPSHFPPPDRAFVHFPKIRKDYAIKFSIQLYRIYCEQVKFFELSGTAHCDDFSSFKRLCFSSLFSDYWLPIVETIEFIRTASFSSQKSHKVYLIVCVRVCVCCRDVKGFADETNEITKQLIFQNHQQTVRDFTCSPLTRTSSFVILIRYFFSSLFFHSVCSFLFRANAARSVQYKWMNARYRRRRGRMNRQWQRNYTDKMSDRERYRA